MRRSLLTWGWGLWALVAAACGDPGVVATPAQVEVSPSFLSFPPTPIGGASEASVTVRNVGRSPAEVKLQAQAPFFLKSTSLRLGGGDSRLVAVSFHPDAEGPFEGVLRVGALEVGLTGMGDNASDCDVGGDGCVHYQKDPVTGACQEIPLPDDTPCGGLCFDGTCKAGTCVGEERTCDDGDKCTGDTCDPSTGECVFVDISDQCPPSDDICFASRCDSGSGCVLEPNDGVYCGALDCDQSMVCIQGECTARPTQEGGACGEKTPCRDHGRCEAGTCIQAPAKVLDPAWRVPALSGSELHFDGTVDVSGSLYWVECLEAGCDLVSVTPNGIPRYRVPLSTGPRAPMPSISVVGQHLVSTFDRDAVEVRHTDRGERIWRKGLLEIVGAQQGTRVEVAAPMVAGRDVVVLALRAIEGDGTSVRGWVVGLSPNDGGRLWIHEEAAEFAGMVGDEYGNVIYTTRRPEAGAADRGEIVSRSPTGEERWRQSAAARAPLLSIGGHILFERGEFREIATGAPSDQLLLQFPAWPTRRSPIVSGDVGYAHGIPLVPCGDDLCPSWRYELVRFDGTTGDITWAWPTGADPVSEAVLTRRSTVILARGQSLYELGEDPLEPLFECRLPPGRFEGRATLQTHRWVTATDSEVMAFELLEGTHPPAGGWLGHRGGGGTTGRPR